MSDISQGPGWWQASDGKWYPSEQHPNHWSSPPPPMSGFAGAPYPVTARYYPTGQAQSTSGLAIASLVLSLIWLGGLGSVLAIVFGIVARRRIRASGGTQGGDGLAIAGLIVGIFGLLPVVLLWGLVFALRPSVERATRNQIAACRADAKSVETALEAYRAQNNGSYPSLLAPWSASTYEANYMSLTSTNSNGGPPRPAAPPT